VKRVPARTSAGTPAGLLVALVLAAAAAGAALTWVVDQQGGDPGSASASSQAGPSGTGAPAVKTALPGLVAPPGDPMLPSLGRARPAAGTVVRAEGPFDDRLRLARLRLEGARVTGEVTVTSDVSEILELQVLVGFYDRAGRLLGTNRYDRLEGHQDGHAGAAPPEEVRFSVAVPRDLRDRVASAAVGVPVLVNE
jgi:hypothetical protein